MGIRVNVIKKSIFGRIKVLIKVLIKESKFLFAFFFLRLDFFELFLLALSMLLFITKKKKKNCDWIGTRASFHDLCRSLDHTRPSLFPVLTL